MNVSMKYCFFGLLSCRLNMLLQYFLIVTLVHQNVDEICWTWFCAWFIYFRNIVKFTLLYQLCLNERDRIGFFIGGHCYCWCRWLAKVDCSYALCRSQVNRCPLKKFLLCNFFRKVQVRSFFVDHSRSFGVFILQSI